jgi:thioredoxin reductase
VTSLRAARGAEHVDVLVIGAGPAGLGAARALALAGIQHVLVIDREAVAGGIPRHCHHSGFGIRDLHRAMSGPRYAEALVRRTLAKGARIETEAMATGWSAPGVISLTSPTGIRTVSAEAIVLATGARERPRSARLVPGDRPAGVFTTGELQQWSHHDGLSVGRRAIVVGAEHVSYSAVQTLRAAGVRTVGMVSDLPRHQTYVAFAAATRWGLRVPLWTDTDVAAIRGHGRIEEVELLDRSNDTRRSVAVDTIVFTGDWIPDNELARLAGLGLHGASKGPVVDTAGESTVNGIYATGNLVHPAETADIAALRGAAVGAGLARRLNRQRRTKRRRAVDVAVEAPLLWASPGRIVPSDSRNEVKVPHGLILRTAEFRRRPTVVIRQGDQLLARFAMRDAIPNRSLRVPLDWSALLDADGETINVSLE